MATTSAKEKEANIVSGRATRVKPKTKRTSLKSPPISKERAQLTVALHNAQHAFAKLQEACHEYNKVNGNLLTVSARHLDLPNPHAIISLIGFDYCEHCHNFNMGTIYINDGCEHCLAHAA